MKKFLFLFTFFYVFLSFGQQLAHFSQWSQHQLVVNPAFTGIKACLEAQGTIRGQWINADGAPTSGWISFSAPLKVKQKKLYYSRHGLGAQMYVDQIGPFMRYDAQLNYAGHFNFSQDQRLSLGFSAGFSQLSFDISKATPLTPDPIINGNATQLSPLLSLGAWWNGLNYYAGAVIHQLIPVKLNAIGPQTVLQQYYILHGGGRLELINGWTALPGAKIQLTKHIPINIQLQTIIDYKNMFSLGLGYRNQDALIAFLGVRINEQLKLNYSYDFPIGMYRKNSFHSHELTLSFSPCKINKSETLLCPMF